MKKILILILLLLAPHSLFAYTETSLDKAIVGIREDGGTAITISSDNNYIAYIVYQKNRGIRNYYLRDTIKNNTTLFVSQKNMSDVDTSVRMFQFVGNGNYLAYTVHVDTFDEVRLLSLSSLKEQDILSKTITSNIYHVVDIINQNSQTLLIALQKKKGDILSLFEYNIRSGVFACKYNC